MHKGYKMHRVNIKSIVTTLILLGGFLHAESVISIVTKFGQTGGLYGDAGFSVTGNKVNGRAICDQNNTNDNIEPGCDMSGDPGYDNNGTNDNEKDDLYTGDLIVRTNDLFEIIVGWNATQVNNPVTLRSTLPSFGGKNYLAWDKLPSSCSDGSSISEDGLTLTCVRDDDFSISHSEDSPFYVKVKGSAPNNLKTGVISFSISSDGLETKTDDTDGYELTVTAKPMWNIQKAHVSTQEKQTVDGVTGYIIRYAFLLEADEVNGEVDTTSPVLGNEALGKDFELHFTDDVSQISSNAKLIGCSLSGAEGGSQPYPWYHSDEPEKSVASREEDLNITCSQDGTEITVDYIGIDASLEHVPTLYANGGIIPKTRMPIASGVIDIFVPEDDVKNAEDGDIGNDSSELDTNNTITSFDPNSISGQSNFGDETESTKDNSVIVPLIYRGPGYTSGSFSKYFANGVDDITHLPDTTNGFYSADGVLTPDRPFAAWLSYTNGGNKDFNNTIVCDVMDANLYDVVDRDEHEGKAVRIISGSDLNPIVEYATGYVAATWPPDLTQNNENAVVTECSDAEVVWYGTTTEARNHGAITKVRVRFPDDAGLPAHHSLQFAINLKARSSYLDGSGTIPSGTNLVNYAALYDAVLYGDDDDHWKGATRILNTYPNPATGGNYRADRAVMVRAKVRTTKELSTSIVEPADTVTVNISSTFTTDAENPETSDVKITEMLDKGLMYVVGSGSIGDPVFGTCDDLEAGDPLKTTCAADNQILIWDLGTRTANEALPDIEYQFVVSASTPKGTAHTYTIISAPTDTSTPNIRKANRNVTVNIPAYLFITKEVNTPFREVDQDPIEYTSYARNGSAVNLTHVDMIDILPFNGDGGSGRGKGFTFTVASTKVKIRRKLPTSYHGTLEFVKAIGSESCEDGVTWYYTDRDPHQIDIAPTAASNQDGGDTVWCEGDENGPDNSCGYSDANVTAVRLTGPDLPADATCAFKIQLTPHDNKKGDVYTNTTSAFAQGVTLPTLSNHVSAFVPTTLLGDFVWLDYDADGKQDSDEPGAAGMTVTLLDGSDDSELNSTITDASGKYIFEELTEDTPYKVKVTIPDYYTFTAQHAGSNTKKDSDADSEGITDTKTLNLNQQYRHLDIGLLSTLTVSGKVYKKVDNSLMEHTEVKLYVDENNDGAIDENDTLIQSQEIAGDGTYSFGNVFDGHYVVGVFEKSGFDNAYALLTDEELEADVAGSSVTDRDFVYGSKPTSDDKTHAEILNISDAVTLEDLTGADADGTVEKYIITALPNGGTLYLANGTTAVTAGMELTPAQAQGLKFEPTDGFIGNAIFHYTTKDDDNLTDTSPATFTIPIRGLHISGHVFQDGDNNGNINGSGIGSASGTQLYVTLTDTDGSEIDSVAVEAGGGYLFTRGIDPDTSYHVVLTRTEDGTTASLPDGWNNADGEKSENAGAGTDGTADGVMTVAVAHDDVPNNDFGINHAPTAANKTQVSQANPGGTTRVVVPTLTGTDDETALAGLTFTIATLPANAKLYYDGTEITAANFVVADPSKLTVDPDNGDQTVVFKYTTTDAVGVVSDEATVTMPFTELKLSGSVFDDGDGDANVNGVGIATPSGVQLHATLVQGGIAVATKPIAGDGSYAFTDTDGLLIQMDYTVVIATTANATSPALPATWNATGENINSAGAGNDGTADGILAVSIGTDSIAQADFGINHKPVANNVTEAIQLNPGNATQVTAPDLNVSDTEDGTPTTITITTLPGNATLYYNGAEVHAGDTFANYDASKLTVDPIDGDQTVVFTYTTTDAAGVVSDKATVTMPFLGLGISGTLFDDGNGTHDGQVNGMPIAKAGSTPLFVNLVGADGNVIITKPLTVNGTYLFTGEEGVTANTTYTIVLSMTEGTAGQPVPEATLPAGWAHTGENINSVGAGDDGDANGTIAVALDEVGVAQVDFGINDKPVAEDRTDPERTNPAGDTRYPVPALPIHDTEDGVPSIVTILTLPDTATGILYYDGVPVTAGQVITDYDASKMTVDPTEGNPVIVFTYTTTDTNEIVSDPATITMPFLGEMHLGDKVWLDTNGNGAQDTGEKGVAGVKVTLYDDQDRVVDSMDTDSDGHYTFTVMTPGKYRVEFDSDHYYTKQCPSCDDAKDSNVHGTTNSTELFDLNWGQNDQTIDAGVTPTAHIGDYFWIDANQDGVQDPDEKPVVGAKVELLDADGSPVLLGAAGEPMVVTTDENGEYGFDAPAGRAYFVRFTIPQQYMDDGYVFTTYDAADDTQDSDVDSQGIITVPVEARTGANYLTLDAGINCGCSNIASDGADAMENVSLILMLLFSIWMGSLTLRREEELKAQY